MKKTVWVAMVVLVLSALLLAACGGGGDSTQIQRQDPPAEFANMTNPFEGDQAAAQEGQALYASNCASCHGDSGNGDGPAAGSLNPPPANLHQTVDQTNAQYQYWVISQGGSAAGLSSAMPAFQGALGEEDIWRIVTFIETNFQ